MGNYDKLRDYVRAKLEAVAADHPCSDVDINWNNIKSAIHEGINICIPKCKKKQTWKKKKTWRHPVSEAKEALAYIHRKHRLWNRLVETNDPKVAREYKRVRNLVRKQSRQRNINEQKEVAKQCITPKDFGATYEAKHVTKATLEILKL